VQSQRDYPPSLDLFSTNQAKQQNSTLHIGTHILSESNKNNTQECCFVALLGWLKKGLVKAGSLFGFALVG
jgi:hypothetical protein